jgi:hypothetical protein
MPSGAFPAVLLGSAALAGPVSPQFALFAGCHPWDNGGVRRIGLKGARDACHRRAARRSTNFNRKDGSAMADRIRKVNYCYTKVSNRAGQGAKMLEDIKDAGIDMVAFSGFPIGRGKAQLDFVTPDISTLRRLAKKKGWRLSKMKKGFLVQGQDNEGAVHRHVKKLADNRISVTAADAVAAGKGRYGMILWVKPKDYAKAARTLKAK